MLFHHKKSAPLPHIQIFFQDNCLYQGLLKDIPIKDSVIIEKSILFFDDPEPCNIHRTAVRVRLTEELQRELVDCSLSKGCHFLKTICPFDDNRLSESLSLCLSGF